MAVFPASSSPRKEMLFLLFKIGHDRYALPASQMVEVVPLVTLKEVPSAPQGLAGIFNYHGQPVPVIDLTQLTTGKAAERRVSTRIVLINYTPSSPSPLKGERAGVRGENVPGAAGPHTGEPITRAAPNEPQVLGLMAEQTSETIRRGKSDLLTSGVSLKAAPYLGDVLMDARGIIQIIAVERLLSEPLRQSLFQEALLQR
jgi:chemotaxis-related protein WspB